MSNQVGVPCGAVCFGRGLLRATAFSSLELLEIPTLPICGFHTGLPFWISVVPAFVAATVATGISAAVCLSVIAATIVWAWRHFCVERSSGRRRRDRGKKLLTSALWVCSELSG
jgi:membrane protein implicated in regulation of membrane protease activity